MIRLNKKETIIVVIILVVLLAVALQGCTSTSTYTSTTTQVVTGGNDTRGDINNVDSINAKQENSKVETKSKTTSQIKVL